MPVSPELKKKQKTIAEPSTHEMWERDGFDQRQFRFELAQPRDLSDDVEYIEREDIEAIDPRTLDLPVGPSGKGETGGNGLEVLEIDGKRWETYRYADGFSVNREDDTNVGRQREGTFEMFNFLFDANFLTGMYDQGGNQIRQSCFDWLRANTRDALTFDCEDYDGDSGDKDYSDVPEDLLVDAMAEVDGDILEINSGWDTMLGTHKGLNHFNYRAGETDQRVAGPSYMERFMEQDLVDGTLKTPYEMTPSTVPDQAKDELPDHLKVTVGDDSETVNPSNAQIGSDEVFLLPDMDTVTSEFWSLYEGSTPSHYGPIEERGGKLAHDYISRYTHFFNPSGEYPVAEDVVHLTNVSALFN